MLILVFLTAGSAALLHSQSSILPISKLVAQYSESALGPQETQVITENTEYPGNWRVCVSNTTPYLARVTVSIDGRTETYKLNNKLCFTQHKTVSGYVKNEGNVRIGVEQGPIKCRPIGPC